MTLNEESKALVFAERTAQYEGATVYHFEKGSSDKALKLIFTTISDGVFFLRLGDHPGWALNVGGSIYKAGTEIVSWKWLKEDKQKFVVNDDNTISPLKAMHLVFGIDNNALKLVD